MRVNKNRIRQILTTGDLILIASLLAASFSSLGWLVMSSQPGETAVISIGNDVALHKNLHEPEEFRIEGAAGMLRIKISDQAIRVIQADCPRQLCVRQGAINAEHDIIVCVPNKVTISVAGEPQTDKFDAVTG